MKKAVGRKHYCLEQLITLLTEIEAVLNTRPLTYMYEEFNSGFTLTLSHFLMGYRKLGLCPSAGDSDYCDDPANFQISKDSVTNLETWKKGRKELDLFWKIWKDEYLLSLREKISLVHKQSEKTGSWGVPKEGDVVSV